MDQHKDYIPLDEVFRKLRDGEEPQGSGSWMRMRELLDKEMPPGSIAPIARPWKRYLLPITALLLLGSATTWYQLQPATKQPASSNNIALNNSTISSENQPNTAKNNRIAANSTNESIADNGSATEGIAKNNPNYQKSVINVPGVEHKMHQPKQVPQAVAYHQPNNKAKRVINNKELSNAAGAQNNLSPKQWNATEELLEKEKLANQIAAAINNPVQPKPIKEEEVIEHIYDKYNKANNSFTANKADGKIKGNSFKSLPINNKKAKGVVTSEEGAFYHKVKDTYTQVEMTAKETRGKDGKLLPTEMDTIAIAKVERTHYIPLSRLELVALQEIVLASKPNLTYNTVSSPILKAEYVDMVPLSEYKVATKQANVNGLSKLSALLSNSIAGYFDGTKNYYAGLLLGGNVAMGNPHQFGMQFGIAGMYQLNERLSIGAEVRYANQYFSNYNIVDNAIVFDNVSGSFNSINNNWDFKGNKHEYAAAYKINSLHTLQLPVILSYYLGRASIYGGANLTYALPVKYSYTNTITSTLVEGTSNSQQKSPFTGSAFEIDAQKEFNARFGLGYVAGVNYDLSRKVSFDARVTQMLWNNNKSNTQTVQNLFQVPTLQVSLGYYFGRKEKLVYMMVPQ